MQTKIRLCRGEFFLKIDKCAGQIPIHLQYAINVQGRFFLKIKKRADQNKAMQGGIFSQNYKRACTSIQHTRVRTWSTKQASFMHLRHETTLLSASLPF